MRPIRLCALLVLALAASAPAGLGPGDLLLVTNKNVPESGQLASHYADVRHVPAERTLALDVAPKNEEISPADYDTKIAKPVRDYLASPQGQGVRCVVLFYGLPIRVTQRASSTEDRAELTALRQLAGDLQNRSATVADALEGVLLTIGLTPAVAGTAPSNVEQRIESASRQLQANLGNVTDPDRRQQVQQQLSGVKQTAIDQAKAALTATTLGAVLVPQASLATLTEKPLDARSRAMARTAAAEQIGVLGLLQIVQSQIVWIDGEESDASVDSELSLVQNPAYPFYRWMPNPLSLHHPPSPLRAIMTCRIDAPTPTVARRIIDDSASVEAAGLIGKLVIDSRGMPASTQIGSYGWFDQLLRDFAVELKTKSKLEVVTDDRAQVILPGTVRDAALYCGWYSLRQYIASCSYRPGAVAYHVASLEMVSLHAPREKGWVPNLLNDGVDATLGAVGEPYLLSFPRPDEFFPLLMTGKPTLAEAYWATCPMTSWKITLIGDPLYRPFAARAALSDADLRPELRTALQNFAATPTAGR